MLSSWCRTTALCCPRITTSGSYTILIVDHRGCYGDELKDVERIRTDLPLFIVRAGLDGPDLNNFIDHFMELISGTDVQATYIDYKYGQHGFDFLDREERSIEIIEMTLEFMKSVFGIE